MKLSNAHVAFFCIVALGLGGVLCPAVTLGFDIQIDVSPNIINLESDSEVVTVHTNLAYADVVGSTVYLNDVPVDYWKSDDRGYFVAKFLAEDIKDLDGLVINDYNEFVLTGYNIYYEEFIGVQDILVVDNEPEDPDGSDGHNGPGESNGQGEPNEEPNGPDASNGPCEPNEDNCQNQASDSGKSSKKG